MTEKAFAKLISQAVSLWPSLGVVVYHRVGRIAVNQTIVYVAVSASHRAAAFACAEFIMDHLKTDIPLWKKEIFRQGQAWVEQKQSDIQDKSRWAGGVIKKHKRFEAKLAIISPRFFMHISTHVSKHISMEFEYDD